MGKQGPTLPKPLTGRYRVSVMREAFRDADRLFARKGDKAVLRREVLKLRFFPGRRSDEPAVDLNWVRIGSIAGMFVAELRIGNRIGGHDNLRVMFWVPEEKLVDMPTIWIIYVFDKKTQKLSDRVKKLCSARVKPLTQRYYAH